MSLKGKTVALIGCGRLGLLLAPQLQRQGATVTAFRRNISQLPSDLTAQNLDIHQADSLVQLAEQQFDYIVITLTPDAFTEEAYQKTYVQGLINILSAIKNCTPERLLWVSSTGVYHQNQDEWVDENSPTLPQRFSGQALLAAEELLNGLDFATIVRFSGIYRSESYRLFDQLNRGELCHQIEPDSFSNRIHQDDCAGILLHLLQLSAQGKLLEKIYLASDCEPVRYSELVQWLSLRAGKSLNKIGSSNLSKVGSKRCSNQRLLDSGYRFIYPSFREGLTELVKRQ